MRVANEKWGMKPLGAVADLCLGKMLDQNKNKGEPLPYLANVNVRWGEFSLGNLRTMRFEPKEMARYGLKFGDIVMCEGGEPGRCAIWKNQVPGMMIQKALHRIRASEVLDYRFLHYNFLYIAQSKGFDQFFTGSTIKHLPLEKLAKVEVSVPPLSVQQRIAGILSAYDELIENNQRRIRILEEMARTLYREWFVHFRFPGHQKVPRIASPLGIIPRGWEVLEFRDLFDIRYGKTLPKTEISDSGSYPVYGAGDVIGFYDKMLCPNKCALVTSRGNGSGTVWRTREAAFVTNNSLIMLPREDRRYWDYSFIELLLKHASVMEAKTGSAQPQVTIENLNYVKAIVPVKSLVEKFCAISTPMCETVDLLYRQVKTLRQTRDLLLPRLLSGQIHLMEN